jgi:HSP90 family molecular chaperone
MLCCVQVLRFLSERQKREPEAYDEWYKEFNAFIKEGKCCAVLCCMANVTSNAGRVVSLIVVDTC